MKKSLSLLLISAIMLILISCSGNGGKVSVIVSTPNNPRLSYAKAKLEQALEEAVVPHGSWVIELQESGRTPKEGFSITRTNERITIAGNDGNGVIYGVDEFIERTLQSTDAECWTMSRAIIDAPEMAFRGCNFAFQDCNHLPEWFYDEAQWVDFLDMMAANRMNALYLPKSLMEIDSTTMAADKAALAFLSNEAECRGITLIKMEGNALYGVFESKDTVFAAPLAMPYLEPLRWSSPLLICDTVVALQKAGSSVLNLSVLSSNSDYPYTADKLADGSRMSQIERDWMWYRAWGRYAWQKGSLFVSNSEPEFWNQQLAYRYHTTLENAALIQLALTESGMIAPVLQQNFGLADDSRQTLLLGMLCSQLLNPSKYVNSEELDLQIGRLPLDIVAECLKHSLKAVEAVDEVKVKKIERNCRAEFLRLRNDMYCYRDFVYAFMYKVQACLKVEDYQNDHDISHLDEALNLLGKSIGWWRGLVLYTQNDYLYANSIQTAMREIPVSGVDGAYSRWSDMLSVYEREESNLAENIETLKRHIAAVEAGVVDSIIPLRPARVQLIGRYTRGSLKKGSVLIADRPGNYLLSIAEELQYLTPILYDQYRTIKDNCVIEFETEEPVQLLIGYYRDDQVKFARPPQPPIDVVDISEHTDAVFYPVLKSALHMRGMPLVNVHSYHFEAGHHTFALPKGLSLVLGFTYDDVTPRNVGLEGNSDMLWLFN